MSQESTGILLVEDDIAFAQLATRMIASIAPDYHVDHESTLTRALARLDGQPYDAVLLDLGLPDSSGLDTLVACAGRAPSLPVVVLTSQADQSFARRAIQRGAQDYVLKGDVSPELLVKTLRYAIERKRTVLRYERRLRVIGEAGAVLDSRQPESMLDDLSRLVVRSIADFCAIVHLNDDSAPGQAYVAHGRGAQSGDHAADAVAAPVLLPDEHRQSLLEGRSVLMREVVRAGPWQNWTSMMQVPLQVGGRVSGAMVVALTGRGRRFDPDDLATVEDLAQRTALALDRIRLLRDARELFDGDLTGNFVASADGTLLECNPAFARMLGFASIDEALATSATAILGGDVNWRGFVAGVVRERRLRQHELALQTRDGAQVHVLVSATGLFNDAETITRIRGQFYDLTAHKQLEAQLSQSQKMEAVGRLAGGIAHDFNNLLTVIGGQAGGLLERLQRDDPLAQKAEAIVSAADRAASLTQQLLAFSRRQVLSPQVLSLNTIVSHVHGMLERVIGEHITCRLSLASGVDNVRADPGHIEQALLNLALNARDAMPHGGTLMISTAVVELDDVYSRQHATAQPGRYVRLAVSDTGYGMPPETRSRIFEPFFTTKEMGKGTGLGLSMVYGIVKQSGGYIWVYSEPGTGTTFKIYLPSVDAAVEEPLQQPEPVVPTGTETVLLVEDEDGVRDLLQEILTDQGYRVLSASRGAEALRISDLADEDIPLLVTDVVMPQMSGRELARRLRARRPSLRVLYLSGYTEEAIAQHGVIEPDAAFLQKPFTRVDLARKIREVLAARAPH